MTGVRQSAGGFNAGVRVEEDPNLYAEIPEFIARNPRLSAGAKLCYGVLDWYWRVRGRGPSLAELARDLGRPEGAARRFLGELVRFGLVEEVVH